MGSQGLIDARCSGRPQCRVHIPDRVDTDDGARQQRQLRQRRSVLQRFLAGRQFRDHRHDDRLQWKRPRPDHHRGPHGGDDRRKAPGQKRRCDAGQQHRHPSAMRRDPRAGSRARARARARDWTASAGRRPAAHRGHWPGPGRRHNGEPRWRRRRCEALPRPRFQARITARDDSGIRRVEVFLDGDLIKRTSLGGSTSGSGPSGCAPVATRSGSWRSTTRATRP